MSAHIKGVAHCNVSFIEYVELSQLQHAITMIVLTSVSSAIFNLIS